MPAPAQSQTTVSNLHQKAEAAFAKKQFQDAIALCRHILKAKPKFSPAYKTLGKALLANGNLEEAAKAFQQAITLDPRAEAYANLGSVRAQQERWQDALNCYQKALEIDPQSAGVHRNMARLWQRLNQLESAAAAWERAYSLEPEKVKPQDRLRLGDDFSKLGQLEKAIACYQRAIEAKPNWEEAYQRLGNILEKAGRWQEATEAWKRAMQCRHPQPIPPQQAVVANGQNNTAESYKRACQAHLEKQEWSAAITAAKQALAIQEDARTWHWLGKAQQNTKQIQAAAQSYQKAIALQPFPESYANLGSLYASQKQWQKAIGYYQAALKLDAQQAGIWRNLARAFERSEDPKKAASAWYRAYRLEPNRATAQQHFQLGKTLEEYGQITDAIACYQNAVAREPSWGLAHYRLGETLKKAQRWEEATASLRRAVECQSEDSSHTILRENKPVNDTPVAEKREQLSSKGLLEKALESDDADIYLRLAQVYLEEGQSQRAIAAARQAVAMQRNATTYRWLGKTLQAGKQLEEAKQCYQTAISLQPRSADLQVDLGDWHQVQQHWRRAIAHYRKALKLDETHVEAYRGLANAFEKLGDASKATQYRYYVLSRGEAASAEECLQLARGLAQQKKWDQAITCCEQALALDSEWADANRELANLLVHQGRTGEAIQYYRRVLSQQPNSTGAWQGLGKALMEFGQHEEAESCYRQAEWLLMQAEEPSSSNTGIEPAMAIQQQAEIVFQQGKPELALQQYREAFAYLTGKKEVDPGQVQIFLFSDTESGELLLNNAKKQSLASLTRLTLIANAFPTFTKGLAWCLEGLAKLKGKNSGQGAQKVIEKTGKTLNSPSSLTPEASVKHDPSQLSATGSSPSFAALEHKAQSCLEAGQLEQCLTLCQKLVEQYPQSARGYKLLGRASHLNGELSFALEAYRKAIALDWKDADVFLWSGEILASQQQWQGAITQYRQALQYNPQSWQVYHQLGDALEATGDTDGAIAAYEKAVELAS